MSARIISALMIPFRRHLLEKKRTRCSELLCCLCIAFFTNRTSGAVLMDQIGTPENYTLGLGPKKPSQISPVTPEFFDPSFDSTILEDFTANSGELQVFHVSALFEAQGGFASFAGAFGYRVDVFSDPSLAGTSLVGDVASQFIIAGSGAGVTQIPDLSGLAEYGLVSLDVNINLTSAGTYWLGVSVIAPFESGIFFLQHSGAATAGNADAKFANPEDGFGLGPLIAADLDYAYAIEAIPEPVSALLGALGLAMLLGSRKRSLVNRGVLG